MDCIFDEFDFYSIEKQHFLSVLIDGKQIVVQYEFLQKIITFTSFFSQKRNMKLIIKGWEREVNDWKFLCSIVLKHFFLQFDFFGFRLKILILKNA